MKVKCSVTIITNNMYWQTLFVFCCIVLSNCEEYQDSLKRLWNKDSDSVIDVTSASIVIQPSRFRNQYAEAKIPYTYRRYAFKPRAIPLKEEPQVERSNFYTEEIKNKTDILFPGNYLPIAKVKDNGSDGQFEAKSIPLIRSDEFERRSLDVDEPIIEKPEGFMEESASKRSLSYIMGSLDGHDGNDYGSYEEEDVIDEERKKGVKKPKPKKLKKYMLPLLLAYKMKYFALVPVMIAGLVLLVGATGLAGFFFALFAAVMGLQKGGY